MHGPMNVKITNALFFQYDAMLCSVQKQIHQYYSTYSKRYWLLPSPWKGRGSHTVCYFRVTHITVWEPLVYKVLWSWMGLGLTPRVLVGPKDERMASLQKKICNRPQDCMV
jgi:hypothetical protein